jgi:hypothetical protein
VTIYLRDVATVSDGFAPQTNIVRQDGQRGVLVSIPEGGQRLHHQRGEGHARHAAARRADACRRN